MQLGVFWQAGAHLFADASHCGQAAHSSHENQGLDRRQEMDLYIHAGLGVLSE